MMMKLKVGKPFSNESKPAIGFAIAGQILTPLGVGEMYPILEMDGATTSTMCEDVEARVLGEDVKACLHIPHPKRRDLDALAIALNNSRGIRYVLDNPHCRDKGIIASYDVEAKRAKAGYGDSGYYQVVFDMNEDTLTLINEYKIDPSKGEKGICEVVYFSHLNEILKKVVVQSWWRLSNEMTNKGESERLQEDLKTLKVCYKSGTTEFMSEFPNIRDSTKEWVKNPNGDISFSLKTLKGNNDFKLCKKQKFGPDKTMCTFVVLRGYCFVMESLSGKTVLRFFRTDSLDDDMQRKLCVLVLMAMEKRKFNVKNGVLQLLAQIGLCRGLSFRQRDDGGLVEKTEGKISWDPKQGKNMRKVHIGNAAYDVPHQDFIERSLESSPSDYFHWGAPPTCELESQYLHCAPPTSDIDDEYLHCDEYLVPIDRSIDKHEYESISDPEEEDDEEPIYEDVS